MADPYSNSLSKWLKYSPFLYHHSKPNCSTNCSTSPPPSAPTQETLPLLSLVTVQDQPGLKAEAAIEGDKDDQDSLISTVLALQIGLPCNNNKGVEDEADDCGSLMNSRINKGEYWIPTPTQILKGPTQFSCPVCSKTFNRYNNLQVYIYKLFIFLKKHFFVLWISDQK